MASNPNDNIHQEHRSEVGVPRSFSAVFHKRSPKLERRPKQDIERQLWTWKWMESNFHVKDANVSNKQQPSPEEKKIEITDKEKQKKEDTGICLACFFSILFLAFVVLIVIVTVLSVVVEKDITETMTVNKSTIQSQGDA